MILRSCRDGVLIYCDPHQPRYYSSNKIIILMPIFRPLLCAAAAVCCGVLVFLRPVRYVLLR